MESWSWTDSNGNASAEQTQTAYKILHGILPASAGFSHLVWNDLVDMAGKAVTYAGSSWYSYGGLSINACKVSAGGTLSAAKYNAIRFNLGSIVSTGITDRTSGDEIKGYYIEKLTDVINEILEQEEQ